MRRGRATTLEMAIPARPLVLVRRERAKGMAKTAAAWTLMAAACFASFAIAHRLRAHQAGDTECCAPVAAQKAR